MLLLLDYFGTIVFALSGALAAGRKDMDFFGALVLATATAIGGGTIRDLLLDAPVFWMTQTIYLLLILSTCFLAYFFMRSINRIRRKYIEIADAIGLAAFTVIGCYKTIQFGFPPSIAVVMGIMTGVAGGVIRDVLCNEVPLVLSSRHLYATACLFGALCFVGVYTHVDIQWALLLGGLVTLSLRIAAIQWGLKIPSFPKHVELPEEPITKTSKKTKSKTKGR